MSYLALYRKWRPLVFEDVVEQSVVVQTLKNSATSDRIGHAYLFCGSRGTGKTTIAKIFSRAINCLEPRNGDPCNLCKICTGILSGSNMDVIEIDAASNNGVDNIREIRDEVLYTPAESRFKVYIIDEVHMLSSGAFNALLKTLEEPPSHVVFILATTEPHKLPATILSRCQRYDFRRISISSIASRLDKISKESGFSLSPESANMIAKLSDGGLRDAISILDQCFSSGKTNIETQDVVAIVGISDYDFIMGFANYIITKDIISIFDMIEELTSSGKDARYFISQLVLFFRDLMILNHSLEANCLSFAISDDDKNKLLLMSKNTHLKHVITIIKELSILENNLRWSKNPRILIEITMVKICDGQFFDKFDQFDDRLVQIEERIKSGSFSPSMPTVPNKQTTSFQSAEKISRKPIKVTPQIQKGEQILFWNEIIQEINSMGRMTIYTNLLNSSAHFVEDNIVHVYPSNTFNKLILEKTENVEVLANLISKRMNKDIHVKINDQASDDILTPEESTIAKARDIAQKANIPLNIIDE
jgi:DNA polymerase-3 subunit gamma/tau